MTTPQAFAFSPENLEKVKMIIKRYPEGRQASAVLPLLDLAQRQNRGWLSCAAMETVAQTLNMPPMRVREVATFYSMFNLKPVGHYFLQVCSTTPCWLRGSDGLLHICQKKLGIKPGETTPDGKFTLQEVECLGGCANAPIVQINDDYFEDLDPESFDQVLTRMEKGESVAPGSVKGRQASEPSYHQEVV